MELSLESARIRLEGALEIVERATADYERARRLFGGQWHFDVDAHRAALERLVADDDALLDAAEKVDAMAVAEKWPESFAGMRALAAFHLARSTLHERLKTLETESGVEANAALGDSLEQLLELAWAPGRSPIYFCEGSPVRRAWVYVAAILLTWGVNRLADRLSNFGIAMGLLLAFGASAAAIEFLSRVRLELYTGRLRIAGRNWARELPLSRDGIEPSSLGRVKVKGVGSFMVGRRAQGDFETMHELLTSVDWPLTVNPPNDHLVLSARWIRTGALGAFFICEGRQYFLHGTSRAYDVVAGKMAVWTRPAAAPLAWALLRLPRALRDDLLRKLETAWCVIPLGAVPEQIVDRGAETFGDQVDLDTGPVGRKGLKLWIARMALVRR